MRISKRPRHTCLPRNHHASPRPNWHHPTFLPGDGTNKTAWRKPDCLNSLWLITNHPWVPQLLAETSTAKSLPGAPQESTFVMGIKFAAFLVVACTLDEHFPIVWFVHLDIFCCWLSLRILYTRCGCIHSIHIHRLHSAQKPLSVTLKPVGFISGQGSHIRL